MAIELKQSLLKNGISATFNRGDFTSGNAFFWSFIDLSNFLNSLIEVIDNTGKKATGYIGAVGAGETLGNELLNDTGFDNPAIWNIGVGWAVAASKGTATAAAGGTHLSQAPVHTQYSLIKSVFNIDSWTAGLVAPIVDGNAVIYYDSSGSKINYWNVLIGGGGRVCGLYSGNVLTAVFDNCSEKRVTDPPSTAVHIVSSLNGMVRNWASIESEFNPNNIVDFNVYSYPNIKNKFSKFSKTKVWSLFNQYRNFQPSTLWNSRSLLINPSDSIWDYLIGWYWNSEGNGNIVYNMAPGNGLLGGGLLPNLNVINSGIYWDTVGFGHSPYTNFPNPPISYSFCSLISRLISQNACFGMFIKRTELFDAFSTGYGLQLRSSGASHLSLYLAKYATDHVHKIFWNIYANSTPQTNPLNEWVFLFIDDTNYPKVAFADGSLYTFIETITPLDILINKVILGTYFINPDFQSGSGLLLGDAFLFNNIRLTQAQWGAFIYDLCYSRYGMTARSW